jgi:hypothetical protein
MPVKNPDRDDLNTFKVHFVGGETESFHTDEDLIKIVSKPDEGGYHPIVFGKGEWVINMDNVLYIENTTPVKVK